MRMLSRSGSKPVVMTIVGGKRAVLESWAAENLSGEGEYPRISCNLSQYAKYLTLSSNVGTAKCF